MAEDHAAQHELTGQRLELIAQRLDARVAGLVASVQPVDADAAAAALARQARLTKPAGALGELEVLSARLAAIAGVVPPPIPEPASVAVFAADHGVHAEGVSPWPQTVTAQMVHNLCVGGAAVNVLARRIGARVVVVDVGVAHPVALNPLLSARRLRPGTANLRHEPAMTTTDAKQALLVGADVAREQVALGSRCLVTGEMGIANTTAAAALVAACTGRPAAEVTGRGTGIDEATWQHKVRVVDDALSRSGPPQDPIELLAELGGLEIAALAGFCLAGAAARVPVVVDGVIALAAACVAARLQPLVVDHLVAGHRSVEPGATAALELLGLRPLLDLDLRLGEGTGAVLAVPIVQAAAALLAEMATFDEAAVAGPTP